MLQRATTLRHAQRGYNLVEVAIILVVVGLLLGASLVPLGRLETGNAYRQEEAAMKAHKDAILGYAMKNRTKTWELAVAYTVNAQTLTQTVTLPEGRPYLPCPDVDGDGYEDRVGEHASPQGVYPSEEAGIVQWSTRLGFGTFQPLRVSELDTTTSDNPILSEGNCVVTRGNLPWKTLGVPETDYWGNRYTYQVDDVFSNALVGFNQDSAADAFDPRKPVTLNTEGQWEYDRRDVVTTLSIVRSNGATDVTISYTNNRLPLLICDSEVSDQCLTRSTVTELPVVAGTRTTAAYQGSRRHYQAGDVVEGVAYAIISHGENGHGAVASDISTPRTLRCRQPVYSDSTVGGNPRSVGAQYETEIINFPFAPDILPNAQRFCSPLQTENGSHAVDGNFIMIGAHRHTRSDVVFDDIVVWEMRQDLVQVLSGAQVLPAPDFPVLRTYER